MRLSIAALLVALVAATPVYADPHSEMAAVLETQVDSNPIPAKLPVTVPTAPRTAPAGSKLTTPSSRASIAANWHVANRIQQLMIGLSTALAHQAQASAQSAAGQAQSQAGKQRASRNPGR